MTMEIFLDSGAFSAKYQGGEINLDDYITFIDENHECFTCYANLDVIGNPEQTWENQYQMELAGLHPLPIYHMEDEIDPWLYRCLDYEHFCLGGMAKEPMNPRIYYMNKCWNHICNTPDGTPRSRVHGFGMTSIKLIQDYPWHSSDSTSWVMYGRYGIILIPPIDPITKTYSYSRNVLKIAVSSRSPLINYPQDKKHFSHFDSKKKEFVLNYIKEKGFEFGESSFEDGKEYIDIPGVSNDHTIRDAFNITYFIDLERRQKFPWSLTQKDAKVFMDQQPDYKQSYNNCPKGKSQNYPEDDLKIFYAGNFPQMKNIELERKMMARVLKTRPIYRRLISFYYAEDGKNLLQLKREELNENKKKRLIKRT